MGLHRKKRKPESAKPKTAAEPPVAHVVEVTSLSSLRPHPKNYRTHPEDQLAHIVASIKRHGFYRNIVVAKDGTILAGHGVVEAAKKMSLEKVPLVRLDLAPDDPRALQLLAGDNEIGLLAEVDDAALANILKELQDLDPEALLGTGVTEFGLDKLTAALAGPVNAEEEWAKAGMPAFDQQDKTAHRQILVSFKSDEAVKAFAKLTDHPISEQTRFMWFPKEEIIRTTDKRYMADGPLEERIPKKVLVVGCPRSGTTYMSAILRECGLKVSHERLGRDGTSSWWFAPTRSVIPPGYHPFDGNSSRGGSHPDKIGPEVYDFGVVIHLVRHPLNACAGIRAHVTGQAWRYIEAHVGVGLDVPDPLRSVLFWTRWNRLIVEHAPGAVVRLEHLAEDWPKVAELLSLPPEPPANVVAKNVARPKMKRSNREPFTWDEIQDQEAVEEAKELARSYGYDPDIAPERRHTLTGKPL